MISLKNSLWRSFHQCFAFLRAIALLCLLSISAWGARDPDFCEVIRESSGLIPPPLPTNFIMMQEVAYNKTLRFNQFYFDNVNNRAKFVTTFKSIEYHYIYDYKVEQIISYMKLHPGVKQEDDAMSNTCKAIEMGTTELRHVFGYRGDHFQTKRSKMFNSNEMLRFGGEYPYAANGTVDLDDRGFVANKFIACIYDAFADMTLNVTYYFSNDKLMPAGGTNGFEADNMMYLSVPVASNFSGVKYTNYGDEDIKNYTLEAKTNIPWFKGNPEFDYDTFQIPSLMYCEGYKSAKKMPELPEEFSTRVEISSFTQDEFGRMQSAEIVMYNQIYYSFKSNFVRRDFTPIPEQNKEIIDKFKNNGRVKQIYDYNVGVTYIIHESTGRCFARAINTKDYFETTKEEMWIMMQDPNEFFLVNPEKQEYKGKYYARDIETEMWAGKEVIANTTFYRETLMSTAGWHEEADEKVGYAVPVRQTEIVDKYDDNGAFTQTVTEKNYFKFKVSPPPLFAYRMDGCTETIDHKIIFLKLDIAPKDKNFINTNRWYFYQAAQYYLADISGIGTPLRIQKFELLPAGDEFFLSFAFMDKVVVGEKGLSIDDALLNLQGYIAQKRFELNFKVPTSTETRTVVGKSVIVVPGSRTKSSPALDSTQYVFPKPVRKDYYAHWRKADEKIEVVKGMSPGGLAGLAIAMLLIGVAIGIAVMYLYIRRAEGGGRGHQFPMKG